MKSRPAVFLERLKTLGISQRAMARAIRRDQSLVSRVLNGYITSAPTVRKIEIYLDKAEQRQKRTQPELALNKQRSVRK